MHFDSRIRLTKRQSAKIFFPYFILIFSLSNQIKQIKKEMIVNDLLFLKEILRKFNLKRVCSGNLFNVKGPITSFVVLV